MAPKYELADFFKSYMFKGPIESLPCASGRTFLTLKVHEYSPQEQIFMGSARIENETFGGEGKMKRKPLAAVSGRIPSLLTTKKNVNKVGVDFRFTSVDDNLSFKGSLIKTENNVLLEGIYTCPNRAREVSLPEYEIYIFPKDEGIEREFNLEAVLRDDKDAVSSGWSLDRAMELVLPQDLNIW
jgi:hypothetical protein